ncbi:SH3 domain-containing protein [Pelagibacterium xiamenense]|uniref:SH3 domain-containing protein n=1 Tax=Pelagibacterium xiamenense TaxID=2901140 RepID=UPI001E2E861B|nr:SH3 domain-containing protein [Pelagibacterium xiamenense]MCD7058557.1 SH3 domain-containing protein [Pelagibacterium xiamenense]
MSSLRRQFQATLCSLLALAALAGAASAQQTGPVTGLPMPRFVSVGAAPVNVRVGPGTNYDIAWVFVRPNVPVEIVQEFDTWRKIRDVDGAEGWVHQSLVVGARTALVTPWAAEGTTALLGDESSDAPVRAWLSPGMMVRLESCTGSYCAVALDHTDAEGHSRSYAGYVAQNAIWGAYEGEVFD